ncbi:hypothetical protein V5799_003937 [Amblyomma americanum]|uniref:Uncharacterized protein n=1 Tax=Amblyomma americanum TaxID=6943 RepID=A0AAQ4D7I6_AMBAM
MAGMAWTLHPALLYEKFGPVLVNLWESGAFGALFRPARRLSPTVEAAIHSEHASGATREQVDRDEHSALRLSPDSAPTTDSALERANREPGDDSSPEPSTSQQNELAFQGDIYTQQRRARKQSGRVRKVRQARRMLEDAQCSHRKRHRRKSSILAAGKGSLQRGRSRRRHSLSTPATDAAGAIPAREVRIDQSTTSSSSGAGEAEDDDAEASFFPWDKDSLSRFRTEHAAAGGKVRSVGATPLARYSPPLRCGGPSLPPLTPDLSDTLSAAAVDTSGSPTKNAASAPASPVSVAGQQSDGYKPETTTPALEWYPSSTKATDEILKATENQETKTEVGNSKGSEEKCMESGAAAPWSTSLQYPPQFSLPTGEDWLQLPEETSTFTAQLKTESSDICKSATCTAIDALASSGPDVAGSSRQFLGARLLPACQDISMSRSVSEPRTTVASPAEKTAADSQESQTSASRTPFRTTPDYLFEGAFAMQEDWSLQRLDETSDLHKKTFMTLRPTRDKEHGPATMPPATNIDSGSLPATKSDVTVPAEAAAEYDADACDKAPIRPRHMKRNDRLKRVPEVLHSDSVSFVTESSLGSFTLSTSGLLLEFEEQERNMKKAPCLALVEVEPFQAGQRPTIPACAAPSGIQVTAQETTTTETLVQSRTDEPSSQVDARSNETVFKASHKKSKGKTKMHGRRSREWKRKKKRSHEAASPDYATSDGKFDVEASALERGQSGPPSVKKSEKERGKQRPHNTAAVHASSTGTDASKAWKSFAATPASALSEDDFEPDSLSQSPSGDLKLHVRTSTRSKSSMLWPFGPKPE